MNVNLDHLCSFQSNQCGKLRSGEIGTRKNIHDSPTTVIAAIEIKLGRAWSPMNKYALRKKKVGRPGGKDRRMVLHGEGS